MAIPARDNCVGSARHREDHAGSPPDDGPGGAAHHEGRHKGESQLIASKSENKSKDPEESVWVFNGNRNHFPSGVFSSKEQAEEWIRSNRLVGTLTHYPVNIGVYEWVQEHGYWRPTREDQRTPEFIANFSSAYTGHEHYSGDHEDRL